MPPVDVCVKCRRVCNEVGYVALKDGSCYHKACFSCTLCHRELPVKFALKNGLYYHVECYASVKNSSPPCARCALPVLTTETTNFQVGDSLFFHGACFNCDACAGRMDAYSLWLRGMFYHQQCISCIRCGQPLADQYEQTADGDYRCGVCPTGTPTRSQIGTPHGTMSPNVTIPLGYGGSGPGAYSSQPQVQQAAPVYQQPQQPQQQWSQQPQPQQQGYRPPQLQQAYNNYNQPQQYQQDYPPPPQTYQQQQPYQQQPQQYQQSRPQQQQQGYAPNGQPYAKSPSGQWDSARQSPNHSGFSTPPPPLPLNQSHMNPPANYAPPQHSGNGSNVTTVMSRQGSNNSTQLRTNISDYGDRPQTPIQEVPDYAGPPSYHPSPSESAENFGQYNGGNGNADDYDNSGQYDQQPPQSRGRPPIARQDSYNNGRQGMGMGGQHNSAPIKPQRRASAAPNSHHQHHKNTGPTSLAKSVSAAGFDNDQPGGNDYDDGNNGGYDEQQSGSVASGQSAYQSRGDIAGEDDDQDGDNGGVDQLGNVLPQSKRGPNSTAAHVYAVQNATKARGKSQDNLAQKLNAMKMAGRQ